MLRLVPGSSWRRRSGRTVVLWLRGEPLRIALPPGLGSAFRGLAGGGGTRAALAALARDDPGWSELLDRLEALGAVCYEVHDGAGVLARLVPMTSAYRKAFLQPVGHDATLSRFACLRRTADGLRLESPLAHARVELAPRALSLLAPLALARRNGKAAAPALRSLLAAAGVLTGRSANGATEEDADPALATWEFADLMFHARSRMGRHDGPVGGTFEQLGKLPPLPALKPRAPGRGSSERVIPLPRPDLARLERRDVSLTRALERRRSLRPASAPPLTLAQLGEFLFRTARVRSRRRAGPRLHYETSSRPYPSGGACYPLELYLVASRCRGLPRGIYHYDPLRHRLEELPGGSGAVAAFLAETRQAFGAGASALILLTARFGRLSWKYRAIAYSTLLKDVGALMQTMYLVATAMGLAPCAIGCGNADRSAEVLGTRYVEESSVGEFLLGARRREVGRHRAR